MSMLFRLTQGPRRFCSDSPACVKWVRKLRPQSYFEKNKKDAEQEKELLTALTDTREEPSASEKAAINNHHALEDLLELCPPN